MDEPLERLTDLNLSDFAQAFRLDKGPLGRWVCRSIRPLCRRFSSSLIEFDRRVGSDGILAGASYLISTHTGGVRMLGAESIPATGPAIFVSNHPGLSDAMALWQTIGREDLVTLAARRELLECLPNTTRHLRVVSSESSTASLRAAVDVLERGGSILTFPAGTIEPDPANHSVEQALGGEWSPSFLLLARKVPKAKVVPALVSGAISARATSFPFLRLFRTQRDRDWAGATLQIVVPAWRRNVVTVSFGQPVDLAGKSKGEAMAAINAERHRIAAALPRD